VLLLGAAAVIALATGDPLDAAAIVAVLILNATLGFLTDLPARRALEALTTLQVARANVIRDGQPLEIDARRLVPGDVIVLEPGQAVPADARLLSATELTTIEAPLTGESLPVRKHAAATLTPDTPLPDRQTMVFQGMTVATGRSTAVVVATGGNTEIGRIGALAAAVPARRTPLEQRLDALGRRLAVAAIGVAVLVALQGALRGMPLSALFAAAIALAVAAVPEGLPAVVTVTMAAGVRRMVRRRALIRRLAAVESLGSATVICTDKTGTLTTGEMTATVLALPGGREITISGAGVGASGALIEGGRVVDAQADLQVDTALRTAVLANRALLGADGMTARGDPTEVALLVAARKAARERQAEAAQRPEIGEVPFSSERMFMATFHREAGAVRVFAKGAPGRILDRCTHVLTGGGAEVLDHAQRQQLTATREALAARGLRVLAVATGVVAAPSEAEITELVFVGFFGLTDPPTPGVRETIGSIRAAGIRTVMLTGDNRLTAEVIARELGVLADPATVLDGRELAALSTDELTKIVDRVGAFSRISPEDKLKIVAALQARGEVVAMIGDGVNDAAALRQADIGVALGRRGSDVAREAADLVLQDDRLETVVAAIEEGRVIFDNIRKFVFYLFSCNLAEVLVFLGAGAAGWPLPLTPLQILWLNLVTDTFPALALAFEPAEPDVMARPPRHPGTALLSGGMARSAIGYALLICLCSLTAFGWGLSRWPGDPAHATTLIFATLALAQVFHLGNARSQGPVATRRRSLANPYAVGAALLVLSLQWLALAWRPLAGVLRTEALGPAEWAVVLELSLVPALLGQGLKALRSRY
jgi:P-type Ca2+ transporter type 2C